VASFAPPPSHGGFLYVQPACDSPHHALPFLAMPPHPLIVRSLPSLHHMRRHAIPMAWTSFEATVHRPDGHMLDD